MSKRKNQNRRTQNNFVQKAIVVTKPEPEKEQGMIPDDLKYTMQGSPSVIMEANLYDALFAAAALPDEWTIFCKVEQRAPATFYIEKYVVPNQENSKGSTDMTEQDIAEYQSRLIDQGEEALSDWCCWIHSHNDMNAYFSPTDDAEKAAMNHNHQRHKKPFVCIVVSHNKTRDPKSQYYCTVGFPALNLDLEARLVRGPEKGIDVFTQIADINRAPEPFIDLILADLGNPFRFDLDLNEKRRLAKTLVDIYKLKGTKIGIIDAVVKISELL